MGKACCPVFICCLLIVCVVYGDDYSIIDKIGIDEDYYYSSTNLRTFNDIEFCRKRIPNYICNLSCYKNHLCVGGKCTCLDEATLSLIQKAPFQDEPEFIDYTKLMKRGKVPRSLELVPERAILRHHIAHFCPNLDDARVCIRKCMKMGKPAFCGKDHVCYCGHDYGDPVIDTEQDAEAIYAQFKDMYEKYFGKGYKPK